MYKYDFKVPEKKKIRVIVHTDCKNEADDQFALVHHLMTPKFMVKGIIAGHFDRNFQDYAPGATVKASREEIMKILSLMGLEEEYKDRVFDGAPVALVDDHTPQISQGAQFIIDEAMKEDEHPLFAVFQGGITDLASAILMKPEICERMTAVWIGGGKYPVGGQEFNLAQDITAVNVVFSSSMPLWQIPINVYKQIAVSLVELNRRVRPCGAIGKYLFDQMAAFNEKMGDVLVWPHGESWGLGDQGTVTVLLEERERMNYDWIPAPRVTEDMFYVHEQNNRPIRVYHTLDSRLTMEDFYAKLEMNFLE